VPRGGIEPPTRGFSVPVTPSLWANKSKIFNYFFNVFFVLVPHPNLSRNCRRVILPKLTRRFPILIGNVEYVQRVMETEPDPNLPNRTRTLAEKFDHPNSRSIVTPDGLTLPDSPPPGECAREWPGAASFGAAWGEPIPRCDRHRVGRPGDLGIRLRPASGTPCRSRRGTSGGELGTRRLSPRPVAQEAHTKYDPASGRRVRRLFRQ
jgi:hypothetical protein